jgi:hypothetical protein
MVHDAIALHSQREEQEGSGPALRAVGVVRVMRWFLALSSVD